MPKCKIILDSETNCRILDLDLDTRKKLVNSFTFELPGARFTPAVRLGRWDGKKKFFQLGGSTFINLLPEIIPILDDCNYSIDLIDNRLPSPAFEFTKVAEDSYAHVTWPKGHIAAGEPILLRDYQVSSINNFLDNLQSLQAIATGAGKSIMTAVLSHKCEPYGRTIVVVPSKDLVTQTEADYLNMGLDAGVFFGGRREYTKTHTICTWQSLNSLFKATKAGEAVIPFEDFIDGVVCIIIDEAHGLAADALLAMMTSVMSHIPIRWGVTGTIPKIDFQKRSLQISIGEVIGSVKAAELQELGVLANCHVHVKQLVDHGLYKTYPLEMSYLLGSEPRLKHIAGMISDISKTGNTLVLISRVEPGKFLASEIPGAVFLSGATKSADRKSHYDNVAVTDSSILIATYGIAAVGINIVRIHNLVLIEPGKSFVRVIQSIGRGLRKGGDKDFVDIYDFSSTLKFSKRHLTTRKQFYKEVQYDYSIEKITYQ